MELNTLLSKLKLDYLSDSLDTLCEQASKKDLGYREFLQEVFQTEWGGRHQKGLTVGKSPLGTGVNSSLIKENDWDHTAIHFSYKLVSFIDAILYWINGFLLHATGVLKRNSAYGRLRDIYTVMLVHFLYCSLKRAVCSKIYNFALNNTGVVSTVNLGSTTERPDPVLVNSGAALNNLYFSVGAEPVSVFFEL